MVLSTLSPSSRLKFDIPNGLLRCSFLFMFNTSYMSILLQQGGTCYRNVMLLFWPWAKNQGQIWHHQWTPHMWFPIIVQYISYVYHAPIRCYRLLKCDGTLCDLDLKVKVKFDITNRFLRCGFLLMFNTFYMSNLLREDTTGCCCCFQCISYGRYLTLIWPFRGPSDLP